MHDPDTRGTVASRAVSRAVSRSTADGRPRSRAAPAHARSRSTLSPSVSLRAARRTPTNTRTSRHRTYITARSARLDGYPRGLFAIHTMPRRRRRSHFVAASIISLSFALVTLVPFSLFGSHSVRRSCELYSPLLLSHTLHFLRNSHSRWRNPAEEAERHTSRENQDEDR